MKNDVGKLTPKLVIQSLWTKNFFRDGKTLKDVRDKLDESSIHFSDSAILMALRSASFLTRTGKKGSYNFAQKFPPNKTSLSSPIHKEIIYESGSAYDFYKDVKKILAHARIEVMIADPYVNEELLELYLEKLSSKIKIRILTNPYTPKGNFYTVARKFALKPRIHFQVRETADCHDRAVFIDTEAWVFGQSLKDAGKKPTYLIQVNKSKELHRLFKTMWNKAIKTI